VDVHRLQWKYEQTVANISELTEIRFKLLAFVPTISGVGVALLSRQAVPDRAKAGVGILGFLVSLGITFYDAQNSAIYTSLRHRAEALEKDLEFTRLQPPEPSLFGMVPMRHGEGLALIYSAVLAGWAFVAADGFLSAKGAAPIAVAVGLGFLLQLRRISL
jgi:hypothetical protein